MIFGRGTHTGCPYHFSGYVFNSRYFIPAPVTLVLVCGSGIERAPVQEDVIVLIRGLSLYACDGFLRGLRSAWRFRSGN